METRLAFNFLRSYYDILIELENDKDKLDFLMAILNKQFQGIEPNLTGTVRLLYISQKYQLDKSAKGWEDKKGVKLQPIQDPSVHPTLDPSVGSYEHPSVQEKEEEQVKEQVKEEVKEEVKEQAQVKKERKKIIRNKNKEIGNIISEHNTGAEQFNKKSKLAKIILDRFGNKQLENYLLFKYIETGQYDRITIFTDIEITNEDIQIFEEYIEVNL